MGGVKSQMITAGINCRRSFHALCTLMKYFQIMELIQWQQILNQKYLLLWDRIVASSLLNVRDKVNHRLAGLLGAWFCGLGLFLLEYLYATTCVASMPFPISAMCHQTLPHYSRSSTYISKWTRGWEKELTSLHRSQCAHSLIQRA